MWIFSSRVQLDISLVRCADSWDTELNTRREFHISARPCIILCVSCKCIMRFRPLCVSVMMIMSIRVSFRHKNFIHCFLLARVLVVVCVVESLGDAYTECHEPHLSVPWVSTDNNDSNVIFFFLTKTADSTGAGSPVPRVGLAVCPGERFALVFFA